MTVLLCLLAGMHATGCGDKPIVGQTAHVRVVMSGVTTQTNVTAIVLFPGIYDFIATGTADNDGADVTLTVRDRLANEVASAIVNLTLSEANADPGDVGSGASSGVTIAEGVQSVAIEFYWEGSTPMADVGFDMDIYDSPDIVEWIAEPEPPVDPGSTVSVLVEAINNEGQQQALSVTTQFVDANDGSVINEVALALNRDGLFEGTIAAPDHVGAHGLRIVAEDTVGGMTQHERTYSVQ